MINVCELCGGIEKLIKVDGSCLHTFDEEYMCLECCSNCILFDICELIEEIRENEKSAK